MLLLYYIIVHVIVILLCANTICLHKGQKGKKANMPIMGNYYHVPSLSNLCLYTKCSYQTLKLVKVIKNAQAIKRYFWNKILRNKLLSGLVSI